MRMQRNMHERLTGLAHRLGLTGQSERLNGHSARLIDGFALKSVVRSTLFEGTYRSGTCRQAVTLFRHLRRHKS